MSLASRGEEAAPLKVKLEGMGFGFLIPIFFISSGLTFDLDAVVSSAGGLARVPLFLALLLLCRGLPALLLYRSALNATRRAALALFSATGLPIIVAVTHIGVQTGRMRSETAAALVAAGMISVFLYPLLGLRLERRAATATPSP